jgi:cellulose synthase A
LLEGSPKIAGDEENNGPDDSDDELNIKYRQDGSSIHQNFAYGSENGDYNSKQQWRPNGRAFSSTGSGINRKYV